MVFASFNNIISSLGFTTAENFTAMLNGNVGVKPMLFDFSKDLFCISHINQELLNKKFSEIADKEIYTKLEQLSILSIKQVINESNVNPMDEKTLLIYSTTKGNIDVLEKKYPNINSERVYLDKLGNQLQTYFNFKNKPLIVSNACVSGALAVLIAKRFIENKAYNNVIVCGGDIISEFTLSGFKSFNALSNEPCRPFDEKRVGVNLGEAVASILITSDKSLAQVYNTQIIAGASANDANHISGPSRTGVGLYQCLNKLPLQSVKQIGFISAHGTATPFNDEMESIAFDRMNFNTIPVNSLKGYVGHTLGAAGVLEIIISLECLKSQTLLKSQGYDKKGVSGNIQIINENINSEFDSFIKTASGFGGCNMALLFSKTNS